MGRERAAPPSAAQPPRARAHRPPRTGGAPGAASAQRPPPRPARPAGLTTSYPRPGPPGLTSSGARPGPAPHCAVRGDAAPAPVTSIRAAAAPPRRRRRTSGLRGGAGANARACSAPPGRRRGRRQDRGRCGPAGRALPAEAGVSAAPAKRELEGPPAGLPAAAAPLPPREKRPLSVAMLAPDRRELPCSALALESQGRRVAVGRFLGGFRQARRADAVDDAALF